MTKLRVAFRNWTPLKSEEPTSYCPPPLYMKTNCRCAPRLCLFMPRETESFGERVERYANVSWIFISSVDMRAKKNNRILVLAAGLRGARWYRNCRNMAVSTRLMNIFCFLHGYRAHRPRSSTYRAQYRSWNYIWTITFLVLASAVNCHEGYKIQEYVCAFSFILMWNLVATLTFQSLAVSLRTARFNIQNFYMVLALRWVVCTDLRTDRDLSFTRH